MKNPTSAHVLVAICTRDRPRMLGHCLESLARAELPKPVSVSVVVVENSDAGGAFERTQRVVAASRGAIPVRCIQESRLGIPFARNRSIEAALESGADAIIFLDDDQTVPADWLVTLVRVWREEQADVVETVRRWEFEGSGEYREFFVRPRDKSSGPLRERWDKVPSTAGVLIDRRVYADAALRFDPGFALSGGSDTAFFKEAARRGFRPLFTRETFSTEHCPREKETRRWILRRSFRIGVNKNRLGASTGQRLRLALQGVVVLLPAGALGLALWPMHVRSMRALCRCARGAGLIVGALGFRTDEYRSVVGH